MVGGIFSSVAVFALFIVVLLAAPQGLFGTATAGGCDGRERRADRRHGASGEPARAGRAACRRAVPASCSPAP